MTFRDKFPALCLVALLHIAAVFAFLDALVIEREPAKHTQDARETEITLPQEPPKTPLPQRGGTHGRRGTLPLAAPTAPYFNPYAFQSAVVPQGTIDGIALALSACDPGRYDKASSEVRAACDRIKLALKNDPGHFGVVQDVSDPMHWRRELARREAPYLAPCMSPSGFNVLYTLSCLYENVFIGYKPEHRQSYTDLPTSAPHNPQ